PGNLKLALKSLPKLRRNAHSRLESYRPEADLSREDTGCNLQHISDRENIDGEGSVPALAVGSLLSTKQLYVNSHPHFPVTSL
uniref:Uncharacterized protein n=1 Tax=Meleagris gallopavo TaxID=9103 RepID=A0A803YET5_MELGA